MPKRRCHHVEGRAPNDRRSHANADVDAAGTCIGHARRDAVLVDCRDAPSCVQRTQLADSASSLSSTLALRVAKRTTRHTAQIDFRLRAAHDKTRPDRRAASATRNRARRGSLARSLAGINTSKLSKSKNAHCQQSNTTRTSYFNNYVLFALKS